MAEDKTTTTIAVSANARFAEGDFLFVAGQRVRIIRVDGDTLTIRPSWWYRLWTWVRLRVAVIWMIAFRGRALAAQQKPSDDRRDSEHDPGPEPSDVPGPSR